MSAEQKGGRTHFGYREVPEGEKQNLVGEVFTSVASRYDVMNDMMSLGIHRLWKQITTELTAVRPGEHVLDLASGTGDLAIKMAQRVGDTGSVTLCDINEAMLQKGRDRLLDAGVTGNVEFVIGNAECLPYADDHFDCITIGFGLRNVTHIDQALESMLRVLKPGGRLLVLEFSKPTNPLLSKIYDEYSFRVLPALGRLIAGDEDSYRYLAESIRMHPDQGRLQDMMEAAGFVRCRFFNLTGGIVAIHRGYKA